MSVLVFSVFTGNTTTSRGGTTYYIKQGTKFLCKTVLGWEML